jgi:hypothetical protein
MLFFSTQFKILSQKSGFVTKLFKEFLNFQSVRKPFRENEGSKYI